MRVAVTGSEGQLGQDLVPLLRVSGHEAVAWTIDTLDVTDEAAVRHAVRDARPDALIHAAAYTFVDRAEEESDVARSVNATGTRHVASACAAAGVPLVYVSTDYVFDGAKREPYTPGATPQPLNVYGETKLAGERSVRSSGAQHLIVRTSWLYGAHGSNFVTKILDRARDAEVLQVVDDQIGSPTWTRTLAAALVELLQRGTRGILHVTDRTQPHVAAAAGRGAGPRRAGISWYDFARAIVEEVGAPVRVEPVSSAAALWPARRPAYSVLDVTAAEKELGRPLPWWRDSLAAMLREGGDLRAGREAPHAEESPGCRREVAG